MASRSEKVCARYPRRSAAGSWRPVCRARRNNVHHLNPELAELRESATVALGDRVRGLRAAGLKVIGLQTGDPDFRTPQPIIDTAYRAMSDGDTHYSDSRGLPE